jgi:predicted small secreted protein
VRRAVLGVTAVLLTAVLTAGCGNDTGTGIGTTTGSGSGSGSGTVKSSPPATTAPPTGLAALVVVPSGYLAPESSDPRELSGPFDSDSYLATLSSMPPEDKALLLNANFKEGYHAFRTSPDRRKRLTVLLFQTGSNAKAVVLQQGFWDQDDHSTKFAVPGVSGASSDAKLAVTGDPGRSAATAEVSFVVGDLVVEISVREVGKTGNDLVPDTALAASLAKQQKDHLTGSPG